MKNARARRAYLLLKTVTKKQPDFAEGFAALSHAEEFLGTFDSSHDSFYNGMARDAAAMALILDPHNIEARVQREGFELGVWDWTAASSDVRALRATNVNNYDTLRAIRIYYMNMGFPGKAIEADRRALDENFTPYKFQLMYDLESAGLFHDMIETARNAAPQDTNRTDFLSELCEAYAMTGLTAKARKVGKRLLQSQLNAINAWDIGNCEFYLDLVGENSQAAREIVRGFELEFPDKFPVASWIAQYYALLDDFDKADDWFNRAYDHRESANLFEATYWPPTATYRATKLWKAFMQRPTFRQWQAEHDRIAAALAAHRDPLN